MSEAEKSTPDQRLAKVLGAWARDEIGLGFRQYRSFGPFVRVRVPNGETYTITHVAMNSDRVLESNRGINGHASHCHSMEDAARGLVQRVCETFFMTGVSPDTHVLVWRCKPEFLLHGEYQKRASGYVRLCFVELPEGASLLDCEPLV